MQPAFDPSANAELAASGSELPMDMFEHSKEVN